MFDPSGDVRISGVPTRVVALTGQPLPVAPRKLYELAVACRLPGARQLPTGRWVVTESAIPEIARHLGMSVPAAA